MLGSIWYWLCYIFRGFEHPKGKGKIYSMTFNLVNGSGVSRKKMLSHWRHIFDGTDFCHDTKQFDRMLECNYGWVPEVDGIVAERGKAFVLKKERGFMLSVEDCTNSVLEERNKIAFTERMQREIDSSIEHGTPEEVLEKKNQLREFKKSGQHPMFDALFNDE